MIGGYRVAALVPMRHASERVPFKNMREFGGRPLYRHVVTTLLACDYIDVIAIDTDSPTIREDVASAFRGERVELIARPAELQGGDIAMTRILSHDVDIIAADYYVQTHSTNPLLTTQTLSHALEAFFSGGGRFDSLFGVTPLQVRLWTVDGCAINHDPDILLRTQDLEPVMLENSNLYIFDRTTLKNTGRRIGAAPLPFSISQAEAWDIDEELDFQIAEFLYRRRSGL